MVRTIQICWHDFCIDNSYGEVSCIMIVLSFDGPYEEISNLMIVFYTDDPYEEISNFHVTKDGKCLYFPCYRDVIMIDLKNETETKKFRSHPDSITDVQIFSNDKAVSITQDSIVRIWDMTESVKTSETDCSLMDHRIM